MLITAIRHSQKPLENDVENLVMHEYELLVLEGPYDENA